MPASAGHKGGKLSKRKHRSKASTEENRIPLQCSSTQLAQLGAPDPEAEAGCPDCIQMNAAVDHYWSPANEHDNQTSKFALLCG